MHNKANSVQKQKNVKETMSNRLRTHSFALAVWRTKLDELRK
jgi:hypothetical protein